MKNTLLSVSLCGFVWLSGCSVPSSPTPPQASQGQPSQTFETSAAINAEITRRFPPETRQATAKESTQVALEILDNAQSEKTAWAVKDWASDDIAMVNALQSAPTARTKAGIASDEWVIKAADSKGAQLLGTSASTDYETAKQKALEEAARADTLPVQ